MGAILLDNSAHADKTDMEVLRLIWDAVMEHVEPVNSNDPEAGWTGRFSLVAVTGKAGFGSGDSPRVNFAVQELGMLMKLTKDGGAQFRWWLPASLSEFPQHVIDHVMEKFKESASAHAEIRRLNKQVEDLQAQLEAVVANPSAAVSAKLEAIEADLNLKLAGLAEALASLTEQRDARDVRIAELEAQIEELSQGETLAVVEERSDELLSGVDALLTSANAAVQAGSAA